MYKRQTWGSAPYKDRVFDYDATIVTMLREAGAILVAKLAMVELVGGLGYDGADASFTGPGRTPWNPEFWSGGSSSGPGAATSAGLVAFSIGGETGGSILSPSNNCGLAGMRTTYGRVSRAGGVTLSWSLDKVAVSYTHLDVYKRQPYNGNRLIPMRLRSWNQRLGIVSVFSGDPVLIPSTGGAGVGGANAGAFQWATGSIGPVVVHQEFSPDHKHRELVETIPSGASHSIWQETDPLFVSPADGPRTVTSPDGKMIAFISDRTGWAHV